MAVEAQDRNHSRHHPPYPFFSEMRRNGRARRRRIRRSSICALREREIADISIAERIALRWGKKMAERAEHNHGLPAALRNALDHAYAEYDREPYSSAIEAREPRPLMGWFVLRLFADLFFRLDNLIEAIAIVGLETFFASGHSFVARRQ